MLGHKDPQQTFADLEAGNARAANKIFEILRQPPKRLVAALEVKANT